MKNWVIDYTVTGTDGSVIDGGSTAVQNEPNAFFAKTNLGKRLQDKHGVPYEAISITKCCEPDSPEDFAELLKTLLGV